MLILKPRQYCHKFRKDHHSKNRSSSSFIYFLAISEKQPWSHGVLYFKYLTKKRELSQEHVSVKLVTASTPWLKLLSSIYRTADKRLNFCSETQATYPYLGLCSNCNETITIHHSSSHKNLRHRKDNKNDHLNSTLSLTCISMRPEPFLLLYVTYGTVDSSQSQTDLCDCQFRTQSLQNRNGLYLTLSSLYLTLSNLPSLINDSFAHWIKCWEHQWCELFIIRPFFFHTQFNKHIIWF